MSSPLNTKSIHELYADTVLKEDYLRAHGYILVSFLHVNGKIKLKLILISNISFTTDELKHDGARSFQDILDMILAVELFGLLECDTHVSAYLRKEFPEMSPIFKNVMVSRDDISEHMKEYVSYTGYMQVPQ